MSENTEENKIINKNDSIIEETDVKKEAEVLSDTDKQQAPALKWEKFKKYCFRVISALLILTAFIFIVYYILVPEKCEIHSDCTDTLMWALASYDSGKLFNPDFGYACLLPFGISLIMQLFIGITGVSYATHCIGMIAFLILFSAAFMFMLRKANYSWLGTSAAYFSMMFILSSSKKLREIFWGHTIYYSLGLLFLFFGMGLFYDIYKVSGKTSKKNRKTFIISSILLYLLTGLASMNGIQAITIFILPVIGAAAACIFFDFDEKIFSDRNIQLIIVISTMLVATAVGTIVLKILAGDIVTNYADAYSKFDSIDNAAGHIDMLIKSWLTLAGVDIEGGESIAHPYGVKNVIRIGFNLLITVIPLYRLFNYERIKTPAAKMFLIAHWACLSTVIVGWVFGKLSAGNWRLTPVFCTSVVVFIMYIKELFDDKRYLRLAVLYMVPLAVCALFSVVDIAKLETDFEKTDHARKIRLLEKNDCKYGYTSFWNANIITILSDGKICARSADVKDDGMRESFYQSEKQWFKDQPGVDKYFLLLSESEYNDLLEADQELVDSAISMDTDGKYFVLIFDKNIF